MGESEGEPSARFNHILAPVGGKSYLLGGETDPFREEAERNRVAGLLSVFDLTEDRWPLRTTNCLRLWRYEKSRFSTLREIPESRSL